MRISDWSSDVCSSDLDDEQPAIGMRLGENTQMGTFGKRPCLLDRLRSSGEPLPPLVAPAQEIALLGDAPLLAHPLEQAIELRPFRQPFRLKRKDEGERMVEEHERSEEHTSELQ